jgi:hypothetical protein
MMLQRCYNPDHVSYKQYGGRGIKVHALWRSEFYEALKPEERLQAAYRAFISHAGIKPTWRHTLDRIKVEEHYVPGNVRWATPAVQGVNRRNNRWVRHPKTGVPIVASDLARELGVSFSTLRLRMMKEGSWEQLRFESLLVKETST